MAVRSDRLRRRQRWLDYPLQGAALWALVALFRILPLDLASTLGGATARLVGPHLGASNKALRNLERAFPEKSGEEHRRILSGMWENLGRVAGEYPHIARIWTDRPGGSRVELIGTEHIRSVVDSGRPAIIVSGHLANWELIAPGAKRLGLPITLVYRRPNNPIAGRLIDRLRGDGFGRLVPKGRAGAKALIAALRAGSSIGMLIDQKMNDGIPVPFFGRDAMTAPAAAQLALNNRIPLIPVRIERVQGARFRLTILPPLDLPATGNKGADVQAAMTRLNLLLEGWIRERPEQWLWLHRRWPD